MLRKEELLAAVPKYYFIKSVIKDKIKKKELKAGDMLPSEVRLAEKHRVNRWTVNKTITQLVQEGLLYRIQGKGTFVREQQRKEEIDIQVVYNRSSSFQQSNPTMWFVNFYVLQGVINACDKFRCQFDLVDFSSKRPSTNKPQGIIIIENNPELIYKLKERGYIVVAPYTVSSETECNKVTVDREKAAYNGVTHLLNLNHRRIGLIGGPISKPCYYSRWLGYKKALESRDIPFQQELTVECEGTEQDSYQAMLSLLDLKEKPTAIFASADLRAIGAIRAIKEKGLRIPEDIAIVGYDDIPEASTCQPPLTTLHPPRYECGYEAVRLLRQLINKEKQEPQTIVLPTKLIIRKSCGAHLTK